jgi:hypothetical protein
MNHGERYFLPASHAGLELPENTETSTPR